MNETIKVLDDIVIVQLDIRGSNLSGTVDRNTDLQPGALPPESLVSTGVRHFVDPKLKRPFNQLRKAAERECAAVGFNLLKGYGVPKAEAVKLDEVLKKMATEYVAKADELARDLPQHYREWEEQHPTWINVLTRDRPTPTEIRSRYSFRHRMYRVRGAGDDLDDALGISVGGISEAILDDVADQATEILRDVFDGKAQVTRKVMPRIAALSTKLESFAFVDPLLHPTAQMIAEVLTKIGVSNLQLTVTDTSALRGLLEVLTNPAKVRQQGSNALSEGTQSRPAFSGDDTLDLGFQEAEAVSPAAPVPQPPTHHAVLL